MVRIREMGAIALVLILLAPHGAKAQGDPYTSATASARELLAELVAADPSNPPGNEARVVAIGARRLTEAGIPFEVTEFAPGRQNLVARLDGAGSAGPLLLLAHIDVVGTEGQTWSSDPHVLTEADGYLVGRGVGDDLGMAALELEVMVFLKQTGTPLRRDVILAWTGDEESGGAGIQWLLEHDPESIAAELVINEGGGLVLGEDGKLKLVDLQTAEKIYQDFTVTARGPTGHSSVPLSENAIYRLAAGLERLGRHRFLPRLLPVTRAYLAERANVEAPELAAAIRTLVSVDGPLPAAAVGVVDADPVLSALLRTTCVATLLTGGTRVNALPAEASANVNCRILPDQKVDDIQRDLRGVLADTTLEVQPVEDFSHAEPSPLEGPGPAAIRKVVGEMWPGVPVVPSMSLGATDSRFLRARGVAAYGINPIANTEEDDRRAHGVDERIPAASLRTGLEFLHRLVLELEAK
jgi:acetylornithine deacetylase/succinyl-diaminopimelate desuccinylase-like protein